MGTDNLENELRMDEETKELVCIHHRELRRRMLSRGIDEIKDNTKCMDCRGYTPGCEDYQI